MSQFTTTSIQATFNGIAESYDQFSLLAKEIAERLAEQLNFIRLQPQRILDLGAGTGYSNPFFKKLYPDVQIIALDIAEKLLLKNSGQRVCASADKIPLDSQSVDLVFSNLMLPWCDDLTAVFAEVYRVLKPNGLFLFASFGNETLKEAFYSWENIDSFPHVHACYALQDLGDGLLHHQFIEPVINREVLTVNYRDVKQLCRELKYSGLQNIHQQRRRTLLGKNRWQKFRQQLETYQKNGRLPISFEIIYGQAWRSNLPLRAGEFAIPVSSIRGKS